jgi:hypothetical protein
MVPEWSICVPGTSRSVKRSNSKTELGAIVAPLTAEKSSFAKIPNGLFSSIGSAWPSAKASIAGSPPNPLNPILRGDRTRLDLGACLAVPGRHDHIHRRMLGGDLAPVRLRHDEPGRDACVVEARLRGTPRRSSGICLKGPAPAGQTSTEQSFLLYKTLTKVVIETDSVGLYLLDPHYSNNLISGADIASKV